MKTKRGPREPVRRSLAVEMSYKDVLVGVMTVKERTRHVNVERASKLGAIQHCSHVCCGRSGQYEGLKPSRILARLADPLVCRVSREQPASESSVSRIESDCEFGRNRYLRMANLSVDHASQLFIAPQGRWFESLSCTMWPPNRQCLMVPCMLRR